MSSIAIILLLLSAFTHAGWNFISKREHPTLSFYLVANLFGTLCVLPILIYYRSYLGMLIALFLPHLKQLMADSD